MLLLRWFLRCPLFMTAGAEGEHGASASGASGSSKEGVLDVHRKHQPAESEEGGTQS
jgi:hypothetical protein